MVYEQNILLANKNPKNQKHNPAMNQVRKECALSKRHSFIRISFA